MLIPFKRHPSDLTNEERVSADDRMNAAMEEAHKAAALMISLGPVMEEAKLEYATILERITKIMPGAILRIQKGYTWILLATLKVHTHSHTQSVCFEIRRTCTIGAATVSLLIISYI